jgi:hypothetical protein
MPEAAMKIFSGIPHSNITMYWISGLLANICHFRVYFNFGKSRKSQRAKSGG